LVILRDFLVVYLGGRIILAYFEIELAGGFKVVKSRREIVNVMTAFE